MTTRPTLRGSFGMSASTHWLATATAQSVLERGGTAVDATVAGAFVLQVVEPHLNGPGGDLVAIMAPRGRDPKVICGQGAAPAGATRDLFADSVPGAGALAAAVPGATTTWLWLLAEHGTWELADVLDYAIHYAETGFPALPKLKATVAAVEGLFREHWPSSTFWSQTGETFTNPDWARTLRLLRDAGGGSREARIEAARRVWQEGEIAEAMASVAPHRHSDGRDRAGVLTVADIAGFRPTLEEPLTLDFRGTTVAKAGTWSQGPVLLHALAMLDRLPHLDPSTVEGAHTVVEVLKLALADREGFYGDGRAFTPSGDRADLVGERSAGYRVSEGGFVPPLLTEGPEWAGSFGTGEPTVSRDGDTRGDTCHIDVVDRWGTMVSATPSGGWLQSSPAVPGYGFCLGTRLQMTWLDPASPAALEPGRRPRTTLSPTLLLRGGEAVAALGTPGGDQQDQWQLLYLLRTLVLGMSPQEAIDAPALHTTAMPGSFWPRTWTPHGVVAESRLGPEVLDGLRARGHDVVDAGPWSLGRLSVVTRDPATGELGAAANPRGAQGYAAGR
jgi:gamma-glutamyltranspeptidase / glutathione hydrolase